MVGFVLESTPETLAGSTIRSNLKCFLLCTIVAVSNFQYGFDTGIVNGFQASNGFLRVFGVETKSGTLTIQTTFQQLITSLLQVGLVLASAAIGPFSSYYGRRAGFAVASVITFIGITIQILVKVQWPLYIGRVLLGIANGIYVNMTIMYISECAPAPLRGFMVSVFQPFVNLGSLMGAIVSNAFHNNLTKHSYQFQLIILYAVPLWLVVVVWFIPESPRWLAVQGKDPDSRRSLTRLRPSSTPNEEINDELTTIQQAIKTEREIATSAMWKDMWRGPDLRRTLLSCACATFHAASGVNFIVGYGTFFFQIAGTGKPFTNSIIIQSVSLAASLFALPLARRFGRRPLLLVGFTLTSASMLAVALVYTIAPHNSASGKALVALLCIYLGAYGGTIGPLSWVTAGEMASNHLRSYTFGVGMAVGFFFAWLTTFTTPYFINTGDLNWGAKVAWIWAPSNLITLVFIYFFLPETKGRKLEELDELFYNQVPARKFSDCRLERSLSENGTTSIMELADEKSPEGDLEVKV